MPLSIALVPALDATWRDVPVTRLGAASPAEPAPVLHGLCRDAGVDVRRLDVYGAPDSESYFAHQAIVWRDWIVIGHGWRVFLVSSASWSVREIPLPCYFQAFDAGPEDLLVVSGVGLMQLDSTGAIRWTNAELAIDGIELEKVDRATGIIRGRGEWDPPGGWKPFTIRSTTGEQVSSSPVA